MKKIISIALLILGCGLASAKLRVGCEKDQDCNEGLHCVRAVCLKTEELKHLVETYLPRELYAHVQRSN